MQNGEKQFQRKTKNRNRNRRKRRLQKSTLCIRKSVSVKGIAQKMKLSESIVRSYIWRAKNPEKYKTLLELYFEKRKQKAENEEIKSLLKNQP